MLATDTTRTREYTPRCDLGLPEDERAVVTFITLPAKLRAIVSDGAAVSLEADENGEGGTLRYRSGTLQYDRVAFGTSGWRNIVDRDGKQVKPEFHTRKGFRCLTPKSMDAIAKCIPEFAAQIALFNNLEEPDEDEQEPDEGNASGGTPPASTSSPSSSPDDSSHASDTSSSPSPAPSAEDEARPTRTSPCASAAAGSGR